MGFSFFQVLMILLFVIAFLIFIFLRVRNDPMVLLIEQGHSLFVNIKMKPH